MDAKTFEAIMARARVLRAKADAIVVPEPKPVAKFTIETMPEFLAEFTAEVEALLAKRRELLEIWANVEALEAEFARGEASDASDASDHDSDAMRTLRVGAEMARANAKQAKARRP